MSYSQQWFRARAARADMDARLMVPDVSCALGKCPESVIDIGCGDGAMLRWWQVMGAKSLVGVDLHGPDDWARATGGVHARLDLTQPFDLNVRADLVVCLEVAEHLPESAADTLVETLCRHGDRILFSAAPPGQGGTDHVNEQPMAYWAEKFAAHGYAVQDIIRHRIHGAISPWYRANTVLVCRDSARVVVPSFKICTARYRDCLREVEDAVSTLTKSSMIPDLYGAPRPAHHELSQNAMVSKMRTELASETIDQPKWRDVEYSLWIDADQAFRPQQAIDLVIATHANGWDICTGDYTTKEKEARIVHRVNGKSQRFPLGPYAQPHKVDGCGFGFVVTRNSVFLRVALDPRAKVSRVWHEEGKFFWDLFRPTNGDPQLEWLDPLTGRLCAPSWNEDTAFCEKASACGIEIWVQPQIFVGHIGRYTYGMQNLKLQQGGAT